ncbi:CBS-domain-containing membrane protein [Pelomonas saccharophila]|uniref:CBS-domain-containing membrane protein n=1 Tax=Roseateles saccharophilus TaxID=304 RepID=A0ABU1YNT3_ROSSA|nr:HPP family protein [Roseateles saccharophilus]MDR7270520.1 CBS-domain-containing membrane protein [Roseateles saccharophilus]
MSEQAFGVVARPSEPAPTAHQPSQAPSYGLRTGIVACAGVFTIIGVLALGTYNLGWLLLLGSFGSTAVMMFTFPELHFSQPRSVIGGHFICTAVGLAALALLGPSWWSLATAAAVSAALMMLTRCMHPPAGSNPIIVFLAAPHWGFLFFPTLAGAITMVVVAVIYHRATRRVYPTYWY